MRERFLSPWKLTSHMTWKEVELAILMSTFPGIGSATSNNKISVEHWGQERGDVGGMSKKRQTLKDDWFLALWRRCDMKKSNLICSYPITSQTKAMVHSRREAVMTCMDTESPVPTKLERATLMDAVKKFIYQAIACMTRSLGLRNIGQAMVRVLSPGLHNIL